MNDLRSTVRGHRSVANPLTDMLARVKLRNTSVINEASAKNLQLDNDAGETPEHVKIVFYTITQLFENENDPNIMVMYETLDEQIKPETPAEFYELQKTDPVFLTQALFKLLRTEKGDYLTTLMIGNSLMQTLAPTFLESFVAIADRQESTTHEVSLSTFLIMYPELSKVNPFDVSRFHNMNPGHYMFTYSIFFTLIGKSLNSNNYTGWMTQRTRSFARPLGLSEKDPKFIYLRPTLAVCSNFYNEVRSFWEIRSLYFGFLWAMRKGADLRALGCRISVALLRNAELTNFNLILLWIISINDILMGWAELAKYHPYICAAYAKYISLGQMAPWAKLTLRLRETGHSVFSCTGNIR